MSDFKTERSFPCRLTERCDFVKIMRGNICFGTQSTAANCVNEWSGDDFVEISAIYAVGSNEFDAVERVRETALPR